MQNVYQSLVQILVFNIVYIQKQPIQDFSQTQSLFMKAIRKGALN